MFFSENKEFTSNILDVQATDSGLTPDLAGAYRIVSEGTEEWYNLREKMMRLEHTAIVSENTELLQEGVNSFFGKIADFFKKMLSKIKELWNKFTAWISKAGMNDKDFVKKYEKVIRNRNLSGFETQAHKWEHGPLAAKLNFQGLLSEAASLMSGVNSTGSADAANKLREKIEDKDWEDKIRGVLAGASVSTAEFRTELVKKFRSEDKVEVKYADLNLQELFDAVGGSSKDVTAAQKEEKVIEKLLSDAAKFYDKLAGELGKFEGNNVTGNETHGHTAHKGLDVKGGEGDKYSVKVDAGSVGWEKDSTNDSRLSKRTAAQVSANGTRKIANVASSGFGVLIQSIRDRRTEYKTILSRLATYSPKNESYDFSNESTSVLDQF